MWRCQSCASGYLDPRPSSAAIPLIYQRYYTHEAPKDSHRNDTAFSLRRLRHLLANGYRNRRYGTRYEHNLAAGYWLALLYPRVREILDVEFRHLRRLKPGERARLLDVGCGNGSFMAKARDAGWDVFGCDPDTSALELARARALRSGKATHRLGKT
nr:class I SAM-dependent methyltransferase [Methyloceanibacter methanicus]